MNLKYMGNFIVSKNPNQCIQRVTMKECNLTGETNAIKLLKNKRKFQPQREQLWLGNSHVLFLTYLRQIQEPCGFCYPSCENSAKDDKVLQVPLGRMVLCMPKAIWLFITVIPTMDSAVNQKSEKETATTVQNLKNAGYGYPIILLNIKQKVDKCSVHCSSI